MSDPLVRRESTDLVLVGSRGPTYVATNTAAGAAVVLLGGLVPWGLVATVSAVFTDWGSAWGLFLAGGVITGGLAGVLGLVAGGVATRHVLRLEFSPADKPEVVRLVRAGGSTRIPLSRLRVERIHQDVTRYHPGTPRSNPADVARVTAAIEDGSLARAAAGELLAEVNGYGRPLSPRPAPRNAALAVFLPDEQAAAFAAAAERRDHALRVLAEGVLGEPAEHGEPLDGYVTRALRQRPHLPCGRSDLTVIE